MTYKELRDHIRDLGFEEDESMEEYKELVVNAINRSVKIIYHDVLPRMVGYFKFEDPEWEMPKIIPVSVDTPDDFEINLPDKVSVLLQHLCAYYVWLDDDERKAVYYMNIYEDEKKIVITETAGGSKARIVGGFRFG